MYSVLQNDENFPHDLMDNVSLNAACNYRRSAYYNGGRTIRQLSTARRSQVIIAPLVVAVIVGWYARGGRMLLEEVPADT